MCNECYGRGITYQTNGYTGITEIKPCSKCGVKQETQVNWIDKIVEGLAEYNDMSKEEVKEMIGVTM